MVADLLAETDRRLKETRPASPDDVRAAGRPLAGFSPAMAGEERALKRFLYERMYDAAPVQPIRRRAQAVIANLFAAYRGDPALLPELWRPREGDEVTRLRTIGDYIAGMTDRYAIRRHEELVGPAEMPEGF
jgi:dGTPase